VFFKKRGRNCSGAGPAVERGPIVTPYRFLGALLVPVVLVAVGTIGFHFIEGWPYFKAFYFTVITLTTVGYGDVVPVTQAGQSFTIGLLLVGVFSIFYAAAAIIRAVVSGEVRAALEKQYMERSLAELKNHLIVCGFGRMGRLVCKEFAAQHLDFVVIERSPDLLENFKMPHGIALHGDATSDEVLKHAGAERARALVTVLASDADNLYITMSARLLNDKLFIVARAEGELSEQKLLRAGANRVVSPYAIGGSRVAQAVLRPAVVDFIDLATRTEHLELQIEETQLSAGSRLVGVTIKESRLREELDVIVVAIKKPAGKMIYSPTSDTRLEAGDILIALGPRQSLDRLEELATG
jgi:voltage-gated potassium channel